MPAPRRELTLDGGQLQPGARQVAQVAAEKSRSASAVPVPSLQPPAHAQNRACGRLAGIGCGEPARRLGMGLTLDLRTIFVTGALICFIIGGMQLTTFATGRFTRSPVWWGTSSLCIGAGLLGAAFRGAIPDTVSIEFANKRCWPAACFCSSASAISEAAS